LWTKVFENLCLCHIQIQEASLLHQLVIEIGLITPPIGINVFVIHGMAREAASLTTIFVGIMPFFVADIARLIILVIFPVLVLWLPKFLGIMG